jgi:hypothetical protein
MYPERKGLLDGGERKVVEDMVYIRTSLILHNSNIKQDLEND